MSDHRAAQDGEVSPYLFDELAPGDELEMRGPIGRHFAWTPESGPTVDDRGRVRGGALSGPCSAIGWRMTW